MELSETKVPHDTYFNIITRNGIIGFLLLWMPIGYIIGKLLLNYKKLGTADEKIIALTLGISLSSYLLFGIVIYFLHWRHFWYTAGLAAATVQLINGRSKLNNSISV